MSRMQRESGAVSLFSVIFAMLLMSVVTVSFIRIMTSDQNQATGNDLSQSAYDSAQAGVEDGKRALLWYQRQCQNPATAGSCVSKWAGVLSSDICNDALRQTGVIKSGDIAPKAGGTGTGEIKVQQSVGSNDAALDQAYTCVTMKLNTPDYVGSLTPNQSVLVPLRSTAGFNRVTVEWFSRQDVSNAEGKVTPETASAEKLPLQKNWKVDSPPILRTQFMQIGSSFTLGDFDFTNDGQSNGNTLFLYPKLSGNTSVDMSDLDIRRDSNGETLADSEGQTPYPTTCKDRVTTGNFSCKMVINVPTVMGGGDAQAAYLRLTAFYAATHFRITLGSGTPETLFKEVQPIVDSTGRANDIFRRVQSRIDLYDTTFPFPEGAVDVTQSFCKNFGVTDTTYNNEDTTCTP